MSNRVQRELSDSELERRPSWLQVIIEQHNLWIVFLFSILCFCFCFSISPNHRNHGNILIPLLSFLSFPSLLELSMNAPRLRLSAPARPMAVARAKSGLHNTTRSPWRHTRVVNAPPVVPHRSSGRGGTAPAAEAEAEAGANPTPTPTPSTTTPRVETPLRETIPLMLFALAMGVTNRVLYRVSLVPMADYTYFLSLLLSFGYVTVFSTILLLRVRAGIVPPAMLFSLPFARLAVVGIIDSAGLLLGLTGASRLPGTVLPILGQTMLLWQLAFSHVFLGRRFSRNQYLGVFLVFMGVVIVGYPVSGAAALHYPSAALMVLSMACPALSTMVKERFFATAQRILGKPVDIFVVNTVG